VPAGRAPIVRSRVSSARYARRVTTVKWLAGPSGLEMIPLGTLQTWKLWPF
jgi:hypothetical protein